jgi:hypothetical protein
MLHSTVPGFLWFCTSIDFARIFKSFSLLFYFVSFSVLTAILLCVFHTDLLCGVCFWLIASLLWFVLEYNFGWQENRLDNSNGAVRVGGGGCKNAGTQIQIDV